MKSSSTYSARPGLHLVEIGDNFCDFFNGIIEAENSFQMMYFGLCNVEQLLSY